MRLRRFPLLDLLALIGHIQAQSLVGKSFLLVDNVNIWIYRIKKHILLWNNVIFCLWEKKNFIKKRQLKYHFQITLGKFQVYLCGEKNAANAQRDDTLGFCSSQICTSMIKRNHVMLITPRNTLFTKLPGKLQKQNLGRCLCIFKLDNMNAFGAKLAPSCANDHYRQNKWNLQTAALMATCGATFISDSATFLR